MPKVTEDDIREKFVLEQPREGQIEAIKYIMDTFESGKKFVVLEAPTGAGKSAIAMTLSRFFPTSYYITIQKILQDQLDNDFGENGTMAKLGINIKGRSSYECTYYKQYEKRLRTFVPNLDVKLQQFISCADGHCKLKKKSNLPECLNDKICNFYNQLGKATSSSMTIMNFYNFIMLTNNQYFSNRELMIVDESHNLSNVLMDYISVTICDKELSITVPSFDNASKYKDWLLNSDIEMKIRILADEALDKEDVKEYERLNNLIDKIRLFCMCDPNEWVSQTRQASGLTILELKPIFVDKFTDMFFSKANKVLLMSATILNANTFTKNLGIPPDQVKSKRMASVFPAKNRPILYTPVIKVTGGQQAMQNWGVPITKAVDAIATRFEKSKGIIHTYNNYIAKFIIDNAKKSVKNRLLYQADFANKQLMIEKHMQSDNTIIIAPAMHEGLDLKDDSSRFQIVCKMPFPNFFDNAQLSIRKELDPDYYPWLTGLYIAQAVGRSVRHKNDFAYTYIIDESFGWWFKQNKTKFLPQWFTESVSEMSLSDGLNHKIDIDNITKVEKEVNLFTK